MNNPSFIHIASLGGGHARSKAANRGSCFALLVGEGSFRGKETGEGAQRKGESLYNLKEIGDRFCLPGYVLFIIMVRNGRG